MDGTITNDSRYMLWLEIADELAALHEFAYSDAGPFASFRDDPCRPTGKEVGEWLRHKCSTGRWYWWDKTTLAGRAGEALRSIQHVIGDSGGLYEETEAGREMLDRIQSLHGRIASVLRQ
jgi:hypothetical protein